MSRKCELSGVGVMHGNKVSHSQRKTRRCFKPNIKLVVFTSDITGQTYRLKVNARCIRSVDRAGGFDEYIIRATDHLLSDRAKGIRKTIINRGSAKSNSTKLNGAAV